MYTTHFSQASARWWIGAALLPMMAVSGCATNTGTGTAVGAGAGAVAGGLIGAAAHVPVAGALIGAATGAIVGNAVGQDQDIKQARQAVVADQAARGGPIPLEKIVDMVHNNVSDGLIADQIHLTGTLYALSPDHITWLHSQGVSDYIIKELMTPYRRNVYVAAPDPYYVAPAPVAVGVGFYGRYR